MIDNIHFLYLFLPLLSGDLKIMNNLKMRRKRAFVKAKLFKIASVYLFTKTE